MQFSIFLYGQNVKPTNFERGVAIGDLTDLVAMSAFSL
jgi:hypothetical protein